MYKNSTLSFGLIAEFFLGTWTVARALSGIRTEFFLTLGYGPIEYVLWASFAVAVCGTYPTAMVVQAP